jgi:hypothetical protein
VYSATINLAGPDKVVDAAYTLCVSVVETAKANKLEPSVYIQYVLAHIAEANTLEKLELLLPWNAELKQTAKKSCSDR